MKFKRLTYWLLTLTTVFTTSGCGDSIILAEGGIGGTGISSGQVSGFGSIFVNGVKFDTSDAQIVIDDNEASEDELQVGMTVTVHGTIDADDPSRGDASKIEFAYLLRATVESVDRLNGRITAAGQTILTHELTVFANTSIETLDSGSEIAVSGLINASNEIVASYIFQPLTFQPDTTTAQPIDGETPPLASKYLTTTAVDISGTVSQLDLDEQTFIIGGQRVSFANLDAGELSEGDVVQLNGNLSEGLLVATSLTQLSPPYRGSAGETATMVGYISHLLSGDRFKMLDYTINIDNQTTFIAGKRTELTTNSRVRVHATFNSRGHLVADEITFLLPATIHVVAAVDAIDGSRITLAGIDVTSQDTTLMLDNSAYIRAFSTRDIGVGDILLVYGYQSSEGITLSRLERRANLDVTVIQGPANGNVNSPRFDLLGVQVDTSAINPKNGFSGANGNPISHDQFYAALQRGETVYASGLLNGSTLEATKAGIK